MTGFYGNGIHLFYDYDGNPITDAEHSALFHARLEGTVRWKVMEDTVGEQHLSTVWTGFAVHQPPKIFETAIRTANSEWHPVERYETETEALAGHKRWLAQLQSEERP